MLSAEVSGCVPGCGVGPCDSVVQVRRGRPHERGHTTRDASIVAMTEPPSGPHGATRAVCAAVPSTPGGRPYNVAQAAISTSMETSTAGFVRDTPRIVPIAPGPDSVNVTVKEVSVALASVIAPVFPLVPSGNVNVPAPE